MPSPGESLWLDDDRAWAYALAEEEAALCPGGCGQLTVESTARDADDSYDVHVVTCHACAARQRRTEGSTIEGALISVTRSGHAHKASRVDV